MKERKSKNRPRLLLHTCCGPCFLGVWEDLKTSEFDVASYYYNPNIWPEAEHEKRFQNLKAAVLGKLEKVIYEDYQSVEYKEAIKESGSIKAPSAVKPRCLSCYRLRLTKTALLAKKKGFGYFSTTLLVSPYQNQEAIIAIGEELAEEHGLGFYGHDFRPHFRQGQEKAKEMELYRQKYCGCESSKRSM